ncbi:hypothetical protein EV1_002797 [Malus domestica]
MLIAQNVCLLLNAPFDLLLLTQYSKASHFSFSTSLSHGWPVKSKLVCLQTSHLSRSTTTSSCKVTAVDSGRRVMQSLGLDEEESSTSRLSRARLQQCL